MKPIGAGGVELLIYEVLIEPDREMRMTRGALHRALVELYIESQ